MKKIALACAVLCVVNFVFAVNEQDLNEVLAWLTACVWSSLFYFEEKK